MLDHDDATTKDPRFLRRHALSLLDFYHQRAVDTTHGGFVPQVNDCDGIIYDARATLLPATARFVFNYSIGALLDGPHYCEEMVAHGSRHLEHHHDGEAVATAR